MGLPVQLLPTDSLEIGGQLVEYNSMTRAQALKLNTFKGREDEAEVFILVCGTGCTEQEAEDFRDSNDTATAGRLIDGILILSGLAKADETDDGTKNG